MPDVAYAKHFIFTDCQYGDMSDQCTHSAFCYVEGNRPICCGLCKASKTDIMGNLSYIFLIQSTSQSRRPSELLISQSKFSGSRKFTLRNQQFEIIRVEM